MSVATSTALIVAGVVVAAGAAAATAAKKHAADKASDAQKKAVDQQDQLLKGNMNPNRLNALAQEFDKKRAVSRLALQKEIDPELAALREKSKAQLLNDTATSDKAGDQSHQLASALFNETKVEDPRLVALKDSLISKAQEQINRGATLPPEFQAELVRSGLDTGSQAGFAIDKNTVGGGIAKALGLAGIQLEQSRQNQAMELANSANNLQNSRINILASVFPKLRDLETTDTNEAKQNFLLANSTIPENGLSGQDAVNIQIAKTKAQSALLQKRADIKSQQAIAQGNATSGYIGAGTSAVGSIAGDYTGGTGSLLNGLMGGGGGATAGLPAEDLVVHQVPVR